MLLYNVFNTQVTDGMNVAYLIFWLLEELFIDFPALHT